jgi:polyisoprenyl-phosphate glycosyltransferase
MEHGTGNTETPATRPPLPRAERPANFLLSVVLPCFNEQEVLRTTYRRLTETLGDRGFRLQIVLVDDGSTDMTPYIAAELAQQDGRIKTVLLSRNFGHQAAVSAGLASADGDAVVVMDADLQDPPETVLDMVESWKGGAEVVCGIRTKRKEALLLRICYSAFYRLFQRLADIDAPLDAGDFSLVDRQVLDTINLLPEKNRFFRGLRAWSGFRQASVIYERAPRAAGQSKYSILKLIKLASDGIFNFSTFPLTLVFHAGLVMSMLAFLALFFVLGIRLFDIPVFGMRASDVQGFSSTILTILLIGGMQMICIGMLGVYVGRIYEEAKGRPAYIIRAEISLGATARRDLSAPASAPPP